MKRALCRLIVIACCAFGLVSILTGDCRAAQPNVLLILADDLGYGDLGCYNPESNIPTPQLDRLAAEGMQFTDAHSPCTVCTPTRYSLMTGQMAFRVPRGGSRVQRRGGALRSLPTSG